jgi:hypothetical protein
MAIRPQPKSAPPASPAAVAPVEDRPGNGAAALETSDKLGAPGEPAGDLTAVAEEQGATESPEQAGRNPVDDAIRQRAYEIWESEGRPEGREHEHWSRAEGEVGRGQQGA